MAIDKEDQKKAMFAMAKGAAWQAERGIGPNIRVVRHHDHVSALFSSKEASFTRWPICLKCSGHGPQKIVEGYGLGEETGEYVEIEASCHGETQAHRIRKPYPDVLRVEPYWLGEVAQLLTFFGTHL